MMDNFDKLSEILSTLLSKESNQYKQEPLKHIEKLNYAIEQQGKLSISIATFSDSIEEYLDKLRFECKNKQCECNVLEKKSKDIEQKQQKRIVELSKQDVLDKGKLSKLKCQVDMYKSILGVEIAAMCNGKLRDCADSLNEENKENATLDSRQRHAELNSIYSQLEVSADWKQFL